MRESTTKFYAISAGMEIQLPDNIKTVNEAREFARENLEHVSAIVREKIQINKSRKEFRP